MRVLYLFLIYIFGITFTSVTAQTVLDKVVNLTQVIENDPPSVTLTWNNPSATAQIILFRREKDAPTWFILAQNNSTPATTFTDAAVEIGKTYEYGIQRIINNITAFGYLTVPIEVAAPDHRGTMLVFVEEALETPLAAELERLRYDLVGDGWQLIWHSVGVGATVNSIKTQIETDYQNDPTAVKSVFLLGDIPVPYSGNSAWDGHPDHTGAWPADSYYADLNSSAWTDMTINNATPTRPVNQNVPGDGKFDQSFIPTAAELAVGRVDFSNITAATFGAPTRTEIYRRYLNKNHNWRTKQYTVDSKGIVDDNFGYFSGEAFAADGYRNGNALVGAANMSAGDFFADTKNKSYLFGYGCGGGNYTGAGGVGNSNQFGTDSVNVVFSMLFGSYFGDWDYSPNPFMPSALASKGGILSCGWAGRPDWFTHHLGAGETIGYCVLSTLNSCANDGYYGNYGECGAHVSLMGDPSLRAQIVAPVSNLTAQQSCDTVQLSWNASPQSDVIGYHIYRSSTLNGTYQRLTSGPIAETTFMEVLSEAGDLYYQVRALVLEETPSGKFYNTSTGAFTNLNFLEPTRPTADVEPTYLLTCNAPLLTLDLCDAEYTCWLIGADGTIFDLPANIEEAGAFQYVITDTTNGCTAMSNFEIVEDKDAPADVTAELGEIDCGAETVQLLGNSTVLDAEYGWEGPNGFTSVEQNPVVDLSGEYFLTVTNPQNGCFAKASVVIEGDFTIPDVSATDGELTCSITSVQIFGNSSTPDVTFRWIGPNGFTTAEQNPVVTVSGEYVLIATGANGCQQAAAANVVFLGDLPQANPAASGQITCKIVEVVLAANPAQSGFMFSWTGPNGFTSDEENPVTQTAGTYQLAVTNPVTGCISRFQIQVEENSSLPAVILPNLTLTCRLPEIMVSLPSICGEPNIVCSLNGQTVSGPVVLSEGGVYTFEATDTLTGCSTSDEFEITEDNAAPDLEIAGNVELSCFGETTLLTATSNTNDVVYQWTGGNFPNPQISSQLVFAGNYAVEATAPNGCVTIQTVTVTEPPALQVAYATVRDCDGLSTVTVSATGGTPPFTFVISPSGPLPPSTAFEVVVTDANGCQKAEIGGTGPFTPLASTVSSTNETVAGRADGTATVIPTGGTPPYSVRWSDGQTGTTITNLAPGVYTAVITDAEGCAVTLTAIVEPGVSSVLDLPELSNVQLFPNPTDGLFNLALQFRQPTEVQIALTDVTGRVVFTTGETTVTSHNWQFDLSRHPAGVYFCTIKAADKTAALRVVKMKN